MKGYMGKILLVDLSSGGMGIQDVDDRIYEDFLGGIGLGAWALSKMIPKGADPLGPDNVLGFVAGILTGTGAMMTGRWLAVCKSPLTGGWGEANCGGNFANAIKKSGVDGIFFRGRAERPVYLFVGPDGPELRDASDFWGMDAVEAEEALLKAHAGAKSPRAAVIGTAGEKLSLISGITNDGGRIAARSGVGAVMGSKNLKGVVLAGNQTVAPWDPKTIREESKAFAEKINKAQVPGILGHLTPIVGRVMAASPHTAPTDGMLAAAMLKKWGTSVNNHLGLVNGDNPVKNWLSYGDKDFNTRKARAMGPVRMNRNQVKKYHCSACPVGCGGICDIRRESGGRFTHTHKPEYETANAFGALLLNRDGDSIYVINELLNRAGMDSISAGAAVAFAIELFEEGFLDHKDTGGLDLKWGNHRDIIRLVEKMIAREGIGDLLADGVKKAAERLGDKALDRAVLCGGQEPGMHDPRKDPMLGVLFSADPAPGKHTVGGNYIYTSLHLWEFCTWAPRLTKERLDEDYIPNDKQALKSVAMSCYKMLLDGAGGCYYCMMIGCNHWNPVPLLNAATGWKRSMDEYMEAGRRINTLRQLFNLREGIDPRENFMHRRMNRAFEAGPIKGRSVALEEMVSLHWKHYGWDPDTGKPTRETLQELGLLEYLQ